MKNNFFDSQIDFKNISHALLFKCDDFIESHNQVNSLIKNILCVSNNSKIKPCNECKSCLTYDANSNPDFIEIKPDDKGKIGIGALRSDAETDRGINNLLNETALLSNAKIIKICNAEVLTEEAQNNLLKILEEPPKNSYIFLLSSRPYKLKKTILSRLTSFTIYPDFLTKTTNKSKIDNLTFKTISREGDINSLSEEEMNFYISLFNDTNDSLEYYNYSKTTILDTWNDEYLNFRLNILKNNIFKEISNKLIKDEINGGTILSSLKESELFSLLEELISFQAHLSNKVAVNKKIQLDAMFDLI